MRHPRIRFVVILIAMTGAAAFFVRTLTEAAFYTPGSTGIIRTTAAMTGNPGQTLAASVQVRKVQPAAYPAEIIVPSLGIRAPVENIGLTAAGAIGTPDNFTSVGWYAAGPPPGKAGTALIDGHVDNGLGLAGVFKHLSEAKLGDEVRVVTRDGKILTFKIIAVRSYDYDHTPSAVLLGPPTSVVSISPGLSFINLVTCAGSWLEARKTYNQRLIVTAILVQT